MSERNAYRVGVRPLDVEQLRWTERTFPSRLPAGLFPGLLDRFEGNLHRIEVALLSVARPHRTVRPASGGWSIQEHAGHLLELERLGETRLAEFERGADALTAADMTNRGTVDADYNARAPQDIVDGLFAMRFALAARLERLRRAQIEHEALHPRLQQPMNVVDWLFFMCEHDDHHLAAMARLRASFWHRIGPS
jgi:uncharacterized damage-inducible protein DinB